MPLSPELLAIGAALAYAAADTLARTALHHSAPLPATLFLLLAQALFLGVLAVLDGTLPPFAWKGLMWFLIGGLFNPGLFLLFFLIGMERLGVSRAAPLKGTSPLFGAMLAVAFLGERPTPWHYVGIILVVAGILLISWEQGRQVRKKMDLVFPLLAAVSSGTAVNFYKLGLDSMKAPLLGALIATLLGLALFSLTFALLPGRGRGWPGIRATPFFVLAALGAALGHYLLFFALSLGKVTLVLPLVQTSPLLVVLLAFLFLRQWERITPQVVLGALLTVGGASLISSVQPR